MSFVHDAGRGAHVVEVASALRATMQRDKLLECLEGLVLIVQFVVFLRTNLAHVRVDGQVLAPRSLRSATRLEKTRNALRRSGAQLRP